MTVCRLVCVMIAISGLSHGFLLPARGSVNRITESGLGIAGTRIRTGMNLFVQSDVVVETPQVKAPPSVFAARKDNPMERVLIMIVSFLLARLIPDEGLRKEAMGKVRPSFEGFCDVTKVLLRSSRGQPERIKVSIVELLVTLMPLKVREFFKETFRTNAKLLCEQSSEWIGFGFLGWLIGSTERIPVKITENEEWLSGTKLTECRYLQQSGCKSLCLHMCRGPTEAFFNEELGVPLRMSPNYEDCSCTFEFGLAPLPLEEDPAVNTPCFSDCSLAKMKQTGSIPKCT